MFRRRSRYNDIYSTNKRKINVKLWGIVALVVILIGGVGYMNMDRIRLFMNGYSFEEQGIILGLDDIEPYLDTKVDNLTKWNEVTNKEHYIDYNRYSEMYKDKSTEEVVSFVDTYYADYRESLTSLGYPEDAVWKMFSKGELSDLDTIINKALAYEDVKSYLDVTGYQFSDLDKYVANKATYPSAIQNVIMTSYPTVDSEKADGMVYTITKPDDVLLLVKKGFVLPDGYAPEDLVQPDIPIAPDCTDPMLRQDVATALEEMYEAASSQGMSLVLNSGYRSFAEQKKVYDEYFEQYDEQTAAGLVAVPGTSEHQTGLGVDLTSQSVIDGERMVFGDTEEREWVFNNAYRYGFIIRYQDDKSAMTGTTSEPWHLRYVGKEAAEEIHNKGWILEEYIMEHGFTYELDRQ